MSRQAGTPRSQEVGEGANKVLYLFCFARGLAQPPGAEGTSSGLFLHRDEELAAICQWTGLEEWSGVQAELNMQDLQWLGPRVMHHQTVVETAMRVSPVLPARLGTLFSSLPTLERFCAVHHQTIASFLAQTESKEEWALRALVDRARAGEWRAARLAGQLQIPAANSGTRYLHERRMRAAAAREISHWVAQLLEPIVDEMRQYASDWRQRGVLAQAGAGEPQPVLNLAFLVRRDRVTQFRGCVARAHRRHSESGLELALSGPWPPYSFCPALEMPP